MADPKIAVPPPAEDPAVKLARAETAKEMLEAENKRLIEAMRVNQPRIQQQPPPPPPQAPPRPDPLEKLAQEDMTMDPGQKKEAWNEAINRRVDAGIKKFSDALGRENEAWRSNMANEVALRAAFRDNPEMSNDHEGMAAAMAKAQYRSNTQGWNLTGPDLVDYASQIWKEGRPAPPVVEGTSPPSSAGGPAPQPKEKQPSWFEQTYGASPKDDLHEERYDEAGANEDYLKRKNKFLAEKGLYSMVPELVRQHEGRREADDPSLVPDAI